MFRRFFLRLYYKLIRKNPAQMPMVGYWKRKVAVEAKSTRNKNGETVLVMQGEKYPMAGMSRGYLLSGAMSPLKHQIKNQIFNDSWAQLEAGVKVDEINKNLKEMVFARVLTYLEPMHYDLTPPEKMDVAVREIYRAWTKTEALIANPEKRDIARKLKEAFCLILQDDDSYKYRVKWLAIWFPYIKWFCDPIQLLEKALVKVEHAEVIGDMKERIRLLRRIILMMLEDPTIRKCYLAFFKEVNWQKVKITEADRYHFRAKYFKVDHDILEY